MALFPRTASDTGATVSESIRATQIRGPGDIGASISSSIARKVVKPVSDTGMTFSGSLAKLNTPFQRAATDTGVSSSSSVVIHKVKPVGLVDFGVSAGAGDNLGQVAVVQAPTKLGVDSYADGTSTLFGSHSGISEPMSVFTDVFEPYFPPLSETEGYYARLPFIEAEAKLGETRPVIGTARLVNCSWHGMNTDSERGAFVLVRAGGELEDLVGERVAITAQRGKARPGTIRIVGFVHGVADLDKREELSVTRRLFMGLSLVGNDRVPVVVERLA